MKENDLCRRKTAFSRYAVTLMDDPKYLAQYNQLKPFYDNKIQMLFAKRVIKDENNEYHPACLSGVLVSRFQPPCSSLSSLYLDNLSHLTRLFLVYSLMQRSPKWMSERKFH
ncbi:hypothetical protein TNCV_1382791 [Trichonephila clavipes]|nr:hypothetical protein TNCV_1382791 [Trichonephila clavipes]